MKIIIVICNTYSLKQIDEFCVENGYFLSSWKDFDIDIDIDIEKGANLDIMGTYTEQILSKSNKKAPIKRLQISGPVLMNWKNILLKRNNLK